MAEALRVFVSHSHADESFTLQIVTALRFAGADVWYDEHDLGSGQLLETIERELRSRPVFIIILSPDSLMSDWVKNEAMWAFNLLRRDPARIIIPVIAAKVPEGDIWLWLQSFRRIADREGQPLPPQEAAEQLLHALAIDAPSDAEDVETLIARGTTLRANGDLNAALHVLELATRNAPFSADAWTHYGLALAETGRFAEALSGFDRAAQLDPSSELALRAKADTLLSLQRYGDAAQTYDQAVKISHNDVAAWYGRGTALLALKRYKDAI
jgi:tetratricopeptide (TPR) repeat protein